MSPCSPTEVSFTDICTLMTAHLQPQPSEIVQRFRFNTRSRQTHETVATYVTQLKRLAKTCKFGDTARLHEMMRDRFVCGIAKEKWQQKLLAEENLTYDKAYKLLLSLEASEKELKDISSSGSNNATQVHQLHRRQPHHHQQRRSPPPSPRVTKFTGGSKPEGSGKS